MKKLFYTVALLFAASIIFTSSNDASSDRGVVINGVRWATHNVETPGTFAKNPESAGGSFTWEEAKNACPCGWRLPTREEFESLGGIIGGRWTTVNGVSGRIFGTAPNQLFLPAAGIPGNPLRQADDWGHYWGTEYSAGNSWALWFFDRAQFVVGVINSSPFKFSVRCVAE